MAVILSRPPCVEYDELQGEVLRPNLSKLIVEDLPDYLNA